MAETLDTGIPAPVRGMLPLRMLVSLAFLWLVPVLQYSLFWPLFDDVGASVFPLLGVLAILVAGVGGSLLAYRVLRRGAQIAVPAQELGLFALGGVASLVSLSLLSIAGESGAVAVFLALLVSMLLLLPAAVLRFRFMAWNTGFFAPVLLGSAWPLLVPFRRMVQALWLLTPWVFDSFTLSVAAALLLLGVTAVSVRSRVPVSARYAVVWAGAVLMMAVVPFHELFGLFSNRVYGDVDRSVAFAGLLAGSSALALFLRDNHRAALSDREIEKGDELGREGHHREAVRHYDRALAIDGALAHAWTRKEMALRAAGSDIEAKQALREVLRLQPGSEGALNEMGVILRRQGRPREALAYFNRTLEKNPSFVQAWNNKGNTLQNLHQVREAVRCYDRALELNSAFEAAYVNKARALASIGRFRPALEALDKALLLRPSSEALWNEKGLVYMKMGRYAEAQAHFEKALRLNGRFEAAWNNQGNALMKLGRASEAIRSYNRALQLDVEYYAAWYNEGSALIDSGDIEGALRCLDEALKLNPASDVAWNERGVALRKLGKLSEADEHFQRAIQLNPGYPAAWSNRGNVLMDQGRASEALECYNVATVIDSRYDKAWYNKGCALMALGKAGDAVSAFERSVESSLEAVVEAEAASREAAADPGAAARPVGEEAVAAEEPAGGAGSDATAAAAGEGDGAKPSKG